MTFVSVLYISNSLISLTIVEQTKQERMIKISQVVEALAQTWPAPEKNNL